MGVRLRLAWGGMKHRPRWDIVASDARKPRDSGYLEVVGMYDPLPTLGGHKIVRLVPNRIRYWLSVGAQPTGTVSGLLKKAGIVDDRGKLVLHQSKPRDLRPQDAALMGVAAAAAIKAHRAGPKDEGYPNLGIRRKRREEKRAKAMAKLMAQAEAEAEAGGAGGDDGCGSGARSLPAQASPTEGQEAADRMRRATERAQAELVPGTASAVGEEEEQVGLAEEGGQAAGPVAGEEQAAASEGPPDAPGKDK